MKSLSTLIEIHYLPCIRYVGALASFETVIIEKFEFFEKQTYRNRCHIITAQGIERLVVPLTAKHGKPLITDVKIDYSQKWLNHHWRALESAYRNAPYFEHYADDLHRILFSRYTYLYDLNVALLTICLTWLNLDITLKETMSYEENTDPVTVDLRNVIHAKKPMLSNQLVPFQPYQQVFGKTFVENMSIVDLIFCEGPRARSILEASKYPNEQLKSP